jgi:hypothetical protein
VVLVGGEALSDDGDYFGWSWIVAGDVDAGSVALGFEVGTSVLAVVFAVDVAFVQFMCVLSAAWSDATSAMAD